MTDSVAPHFIGDRPRAASIALEWPLTFAGRLYDKLTVRRLTAGEVAAFTERLAKTVKDDPDASVTFPMFADADGADLPDGLLDALDADDRDALDKAALDFLPKRFRGAPASASGPEAGAATA